MFSKIAYLKSIFSRTERKYPAAALFSALAFSTTLGYNMLRGMKEHVLKSLPDVGATYIPVVNCFVVLPLSLIFTKLYLWLKPRYGLYTTYTVMLCTLCSYLLIYSYVLVDYVEHLTLGRETILYLIKTYPGFRPIILMLNNWPGILYYAFCELWSGFSLLVLFWQLANEFYQSEQAKTLYPIFLAASSFGVLAASTIIKFIRMTANPLHSSACVLFFLVTIILCLVGLHRTHYQLPQRTQQHSVKARLSLQSMLKTLTNPYILCLASSLIIFTTLTNILEVTIKDQVRSNYLGFIENYLYFQGILLITTNLIGLRALNYLGWARTALITPMISIFFTSLVILIFLYYPAFSLDIILPVSLYDLYLCLFAHFNLNISPQYFVLCTITPMQVGLAVILLVHAVKYSFFDATKEMAYLPLDQATKAEGKAAVDVFGTRFGKSGYGVLQFILLSQTHASNMHELLVYMLPVVICLSLLWVYVMYTFIQLYHQQTLAIQVGGEA